MVTAIPLGDCLLRQVAEPLCGTVAGNNLAARLRPRQICGAPCRGRLAHEASDFAALLIRTCELESGDVALAAIPIGKMTIGIANGPRFLTGVKPPIIKRPLPSQPQSMRSRSFYRCKRARFSAAWSTDGSVACVVGRRVAARLQPCPSLLHPPPQHGIAQPKRLRHRSDRAPTRCYEIDRLPLVVIRKRPKRHPDWAQIN
ncbi:hypothetical protein ACVIGB_000267 [Bradyrhizobium sp. USDA 4341]